MPQPTEKGIAAIHLLIADMRKVLTPMMGAIDGPCADAVAVQRCALQMADGLNLVEAMLDPDSKWAPFVEAQGAEWVRQEGVRI